MTAIDKNFWSENPDQGHADWTQTIWRVAPVMAILADLVVRQSRLAAHLTIVVRNAEWVVSTDPDMGTGLT